MPRRFYYGGHTATHIALLPPEPVAVAVTDPAVVSDATVPLKFADVPSASLVSPVQAELVNRFATPMATPPAGMVTYCDNGDALSVTVVGEVGEAAPLSV